MAPWLPLPALAACGRDPASFESAAIVVIMDGTRIEETLSTEPLSATGEPASSLMPRACTLLMPQGVHGTSALNAGATVTTPAHLALVSGRRQALANYSVGAQPGVYRPELPSLTGTPASCGEQSGATGRKLELADRYG